jgi:inosine-uridine nucleoside N-ribohydrolase
MSKFKVIYDTDPGVDDAMALLLLARHPEVELKAITTVFGNGGIDIVTRNALFLREKFGIDAPVARGAAAGFGAAPPPAAVAVHGENGLGGYPLTEPTAKEDGRSAAQLIVELVRAHPGEIDIVAVGRMTNLALALALDPGIAGLVKGVSVMGGAFGRNGHFGNVTPVAEANIFGDPLAADIVFGAEWPMTIVPLDVTHESVMTDEYVSGLKRDGGEDGAFLWEVSREYAKYYGTRGLNGFAVHDSSAVAAMIHPEMFGYERGPVRVVTADGVAHGQTVLKPEGSHHWRATGYDDRPACKVAAKVDAPAFLKFYRDTVLGAR